MATILVISSHYDDAEIGCCETIRKHNEIGDSVIYAIIESDEHRTGNPKDRLTEQINAMIEIDLDPKQSLLTFKSIDPIEDIIQKLDYYKPDVIFSPWIYDTHQAHRRTSAIGQSVGRKRNVTTYFYSGGSTTDFNPNVFNLINFSFKENVLKCFKTQIECGAINIDIIKAKEAYWGTLITTKTPAFAEAFMARKVRYAF